MIYLGGNPLKFQVGGGATLLTHQCERGLQSYKIKKGGT